ncbi:Transcriptional regulator [Colletotrichum higginsianum IMI 349063]|uniref:Transcriptional regulator n=3 Tax=Colletotrichum higginsianum TaxID=80884 RepID=A0A1B7YVZ3_COLHI|nr:Transcriptional regulator [Colletotrichum higginsianum IMI 349063]OBR16216.1 Transcriptional regulator [Colletotrichum higginsianum IMI 349063]
MPEARTRSDTGAQRSPSPAERVPYAGCARSAAARARQLCHLHPNTVFRRVYTSGKEPSSSHTIHHRSYAHQLRAATRTPGLQLTHFHNGNYKTQLVSSLSFCERMAPSDKKLETALLDTVRDVYKTDLDNLTVNFIRKRVESDLELEAGFFSSGKWKDKSKKLVKELATALMEGNADPDPESEEDASAKPKKTGKRQSADTSPPAKRRKRASAQKEEDLEDSGIESDKPEPKSKPKPKPKKAAPRKKKQDTPVIDSDSEPSPVKSNPSKARNGRASKIEDSGSDDLSSPPDSDEDALESQKAETEDEKPKAPLEKEVTASVDTKEDKPTGKNPQVTTERKDEVKPAMDDTSSELSDVIDEPPKPKRKKKEAGAGSKAPKPKKASAAPENPDDAEVKKLQSQLVKCGIRKIWGFELKQYGDDTKAKIRHLRELLKDIGMDGRFSEAKAKEIKERRELEADLEAVQEMNANWGAGGRSSRSKARGQPALKKATEDDVSVPENDKQNDDDDDEEQEAHIPSRARGKARADLAFLGDDDEESD